MRGRSGLGRYNVCIRFSAKRSTVLKTISGDTQMARLLLSLKKKSMVLSPQANYTDRAIAAGQRS
jgi:hypothetical protein